MYAKLWVDMKEVGCRTVNDWMWKCGTKWSGVWGVGKCRFFIEWLRRLITKGWEWEMIEGWYVWQPDWFTNHRWCYEWIFSGVCLPKVPVQCTTRRADWMLRMGIAGVIIQDDLWLTQNEWIYVWKSKCHRWWCWGVDCWQRWWLTRKERVVMALQGGQSRHLRFDGDEKRKKGNGWINVASV